MTNDHTSDKLESGSSLSESVPQSDSLIELQLQQELLSLFEVDSQRDLENYLQGIQQLKPENWQDEITTLYRAIHTIKGGAVTVHAEAALKVATILEDVLSDLRYLEVLPDLSDGGLCADLKEAGELLAVALTIPAGTDVNQPSRVKSLVQRIEELRQQIHRNYAQSWDPQSQLRQEFIRDGFDLIVLDLERALQNLGPEMVTVPPETVDIAAEVVEELKQIGEELVMPTAWGTLLDSTSSLLMPSEAVSQWKSQWFDLFEQLKACVESPNAMTVSAAAEQAHPPQPEPPIESISASGSEPSDTCLESLEFLSNFSQSLIDSEAATEEPAEQAALETLETLDALSALEDVAAQLEGVIPAKPGPTISPTAEANRPVVKPLADDDLTNGDLADRHIAAETPASETLASEVAEIAVPEVANVASPRPSKSATTVHIPIPLERLEASAESVVETILSARTVTDNYQALQKQLRRILALAENSADFVTHLRQLQDDYAILDNLKAGVAQELGTPTPERYRKGYITINRLLEMNLRLSELGAEAEQVSQQTTDALQQLENHLLDLKDNIEQNQLVPFKNLAFRAKAIVRDLMNRTQKAVDFIVEGESLEVDVATIRQLEPALLHLLRNAFDHGLETAEERIAAGKSPTGQLKLSLQRQGNRLLFSLEDDGRGINGQAIAKRAQALGLPATELNHPQGLLSLLCQPGFSSKTQVSEFSGRGVGMDVVAAQISRLGGLLELKTQPGQGTTFILSLPLTRLLEPCLVVQAGAHRFALPTSQIDMMQMVDALELVAESEDSQQAMWQVKTPDGKYAAFSLLSYWQPDQRQHSLADTAIAIHIPASEHSESFYLLADKLIGQQELSVQPLPTPLVSAPHILGLSLQSDGQLSPILDCSQVGEYLKGRYQSPTAASPRLAEQRPSGENAQILVVDDAALMRRRLTVSLQAAGYRTTSCSDGLEAWNWLCANPSPSLVITDIEMPYLDGFGLIKRCRDAGMNYPMLVTSSRLAEEWNREAKRVGATGFLTKGFSTPQLLEKVQELLATAVV